MGEVKQHTPLETNSNVRLTYHNIIYKYYTVRTGINPFENRYNLCNIDCGFGELTVKITCYQR
jgi:hypothetical protein